MHWVRRLITLLLLGAAAAAVLVIVLRSAGPTEPVLQTAAADALRVRGNALVFGPGAGRRVQLRGINRAGAEYECLHQTGFFDSPTPSRADSTAMVAEMLAWNIDVVRIPLNEGCWLGINAPAAYRGAVYRRAIEAEVKVLNEHHLFVILTLQWNSAGTHYADSPLAMADADHAPAFWRSVARTFRGDGWLMFDLFNEPHGISWACWLHGCRVRAAGRGSYAFAAAGMQQLIDAVRGTGARQPLILSGDTYALDLSGYRTHRPRDPDHNLILALHTYGTRSPCAASCRASVTAALRQVPVLASELGEFDCGGRYLDTTLPFLDRHGVGYLAWAWDAVSGGANGWSCRNGPALILNYGGTPTGYGAAYRAHLLSLAKPVRP